MKDFRPVYIVFGVFIAIPILTIPMIIFGVPTKVGEPFYGFIVITSWISGTLLCWIIDDKIEKDRIKKKMIGIETNTPNQVMDRIKKALEMRKPSITDILADLYTLQANNSLSNFEFFDIIGKTYQLNPKFFMLSIYPKIRPKFSKIYGDEGMLVMHKYILEKFCLDEGEQIIYELNGKIRQKVPKKYTINILHGIIYVTNSRIIAQGKFKFELYQSAGAVIFGSTKSPKKAKIAYFSSSGPCYGYPFPIKNLHGLRHISAYNNHELSYSVKQDNKIVSRITVIASKKEEHGDKLFAILDKFQTRK